MCQAPAHYCLEDRRQLAVLGRQVIFTTQRARLIWPLLYCAVGLKLPQAINENIGRFPFASSQEVIVAMALKHHHLAHDAQRPLVTDEIQRYRNWTERARSIAVYRTFVLDGYQLL
jgi:hypothetical protein